jgi:hypothetical protein
MRMEARDSETHITAFLRDTNDVHQVLWCAVREQVHFQRHIVDELHKVSTKRASGNVTVLMEQHLNNLGVEAARPIHQTSKCFSICLMPCGSLARSSHTSGCCSVHVSVQHRKTCKSSERDITDIMNPRTLNGERCINCTINTPG